MEEERLLLRTMVDLDKFIIVNAVIWTYISILLLVAYGLKAMPILTLSILEIVVGWVLLKRDTKKYRKLDPWWWMHDY